MEEKLYTAGYKYRRTLYFQALVILAMYLSLTLMGPLLPSMLFAFIVVTPIAMLFGWAWSTIRFDITCRKDSLEIKRFPVLPARIIPWKEIRDVEMKREGRIVVHLHEVGPGPVYLFFPRCGADIDYYDLFKTIEERVALAREKAE